MFDYEESDNYFKDREDVIEWEENGEFNGSMTYRRKTKPENVQTASVPTASFERLDNIKRCTGGLLKAMMSEFVRNSGDIPLVLFRYRESFVDILEIYCRYVNDVINFYDWVGVPVNSILNGPFQYTSDIKKFLFLYRTHELADELLNKMICDIFSGKHNGGISHES